MMTRSTLKHLLVIACTIGVGLGLSAPVQAGPWVKEPGELYAKLAVGTFQGQDVYALDGERYDPGFVYSNQALYLYGELGLAPKLALAFSLPYIAGTNTREETRYRRSGPGDLDLMLQGQLWRGEGCAFSGQITGRFPLYPGIVTSGAAPGTTGASTGPEQFLPALGDGSIDLTPTLHFGCSLYPLPGWFTVEAGPQFRFRGFGDGARYAADVGFFVWPERLALTARLEGTERFGADNERPTKSITTASVGAIIPIYSGISIEGSAGTILRGAFVSRGWNFIAGVSFNGRVFSDPYE